MSNNQTLWSQFGAGAEISEQAAETRSNPMKDGLILLTVAALLNLILTVVVDLLKTNPIIWVKDISTNIKTMHPLLVIPTISRCIQLLRLSFR
jgi:hypothetical protein